MLFVSLYMIAAHADLRVNVDAIRKASLPSVLISAKCDTPIEERQVDPVMIEQKARRSISGISTLQTTRRSVDEQKHAIFTILKAVVLGNAGTYRNACDPGSCRLTQPQRTSPETHLPHAGERSPVPYGQSRHGRQLVWDMLARTRNTLAASIGTRNMRGMIRAWRGTDRPLH